MVSSRRHAWIALGSNVCGAWGSPSQTLTAALQHLERINIQVIDSSDQYVTAPRGGGRQPLYINAVACVCPNLAPGAFLRLLKMMERAAGRRLGRYWGPRTLDLDILSQGVLIGHHHRRRRGQLNLPHPEMHTRAFVLAPLAETNPHWWHPALRVTASTLCHKRSIVLQLRAVKRLTGSSPSLRTR